jgi:hypothetical protein
MADDSCCFVVCVCGGGALKYMTTSPFESFPSPYHAFNLLAHSGRKITESLWNVTVRGEKYGKSKVGAQCPTVCLSMYSITENIYYSQLSSVAILLQPEPNCFTSYNTRKALCSLPLLSSCGLPLPPTCLLLTANEARRYFASTISKMLYWYSIVTYATNVLTLPFVTCMSPSFETSRFKFGNVLRLQWSQNILAVEMFKRNASSESLVQKCNDPSPASLALRLPPRVYRVGSFADAAGFFTGQKVLRPLCFTKKK